MLSRKGETLWEYHLVCFHLGFRSISQYPVQRVRDPVQSYKMHAGKHDIAVDKDVVVFDEPPSLLCQNPCGRQQQFSSLNTLSLTDVPLSSGHG